LSRSVADRLSVACQKGQGRGGKTWQTARERTPRLDSRFECINHAWPQQAVIPPSGRRRWEIVWRWRYMWRRRQMGCQGRKGGVPSSRRSGTTFRRRRDADAITVVSQYNVGALTSRIRHGNRRRAIAARRRRVLIRRRALGGNGPNSAKRHSEKCRIALVKARCAELGSLLLFD
jgi:hypothetical protein